MCDFNPENFEPIRDVIERVRLIKNPSSRYKYCKQLETRFYYQDWETQFEIYELWLDIDNAYSRMCLFCTLNHEYWKLLQKLAKQGVQNASALSIRIMEYAIAHVRDFFAALFVTENAPIEVVRKFKKQLARSLKNSYGALVLRIGRDKDFVIDKSRLGNNLKYFEFCAKLHIPVTDEEAIEELKLYFKNQWRNIGCTNIDEIGSIRRVQFSLRLNWSIDNWRKAIGDLGLTRAADAFDRWDADLQIRINTFYEADSKYRRFPPINLDRLMYYWKYLIEMAYDDIFPDPTLEYNMASLVGKYPDMGYFTKSLGLKLVNPLEF